LLKKKKLRETIKQIEQQIITPKNYKMCHTKPLNLNDTPSFRSELGKRGHEDDFFESDLDEFTPLPKRTALQFGERFEIKSPNLIHLIRDPSTSLSVIQQHLELNPSEIDSVEELFNWTALHYAVFHNRSDVVNLLCEKGADLNIQNKHGLTPVLCAAEKNFTSIVRILVKKGANIKITDNQGFSLLHKAVLSSNLDLVQYLLSCTNEEGELSLDINAVSEEGFTPLHQAALHGSNKIIKLLLANGASVESISRQKATPLHLAATKDHVRAVELLLENGAFVDAQDRSQRTPLHYACLFGHAKTIQLLIHYKANVHLKDRRKESSYALALKTGDFTIISSFN
jgi:ankyrin repeat protein